MCLACLLLLGFGILTDRRKEAELGRLLRLDFEQYLQRHAMPVTEYARGKETGIFQECLGFFMPLLSEDLRGGLLCESSSEKSRIVWPEGVEELEDLYALMEREQQGGGIGQSGMVEGEVENGGEEHGAEKQPEEPSQESSPEETKQRFLTFTPHEKVRDVTEQEMGDYETLMNNFYTVDPSTMAGSNQFSADSFLAKNLTIDRGVEGPEILIYHTHSQEGFSDSEQGNSQTTIVGVGEELTRILTDDYGYQVLHHTGEYDKKTRDDAYSRALLDLEQILQENPSIQVVIDLHRDEMPQGVRLVQEVDGKPTARFMFFNGLSRTKQTGNLDYLYNVYQEDNLAFSFQMQLKAMEYYPGLTRKIYLKGYRYNMHLCPRSLLIELGAQNNTLEEAMNACGPLAHILHMVLSGEDS